MTRAALVLVFCLGWVGSSWAWDDETWDYGDAYQEGFKDGYTYSDPYTIPPIPPIAPIPPVGDDVHDGYIRGALEGLEDRGYRD